MRNHSPSDPDLLDEWLRHQREPAFHALVCRYAGLVHATARRTCGDESMAAEVSQLTFITLARKARSLASCVSLGGWLHRTAMMHAKNLRRQNQRENRKRQQLAMETPSHLHDDTWREMQPVLDEALASLSDNDREALLLRFYRSLTVREIAAILGIATDAAQKRIDRATVRLRDKLLRCGVQTSGTLSAALLTGFAADAQAALPVSILASKAIAAAGAGSFGLTTLLATATLMKSSFLILPLVAIVITAGWIGMWRHSGARLKTESPSPQQPAVVTGSSRTLPVSANGKLPMPKKKDELSQADFFQRMEEALAKYEITGETDTTEIEELFRLHREWAIAAIRQARMPWVVGKLVGKDPGSRENGMRWIEENFKGEEKILCLVGFAQGVAQSDPKAVIAIAEGMNPGQVRDKMLGIAIVATAKGDVTGAVSLYLEYFEDLKRGSHSDLFGWSNAILMEMCRQLPAGEVSAMLDKPVFGKMTEIDHRAILMVGDAHPEVAVRFCLKKNSKPVLLHEMALRRLYQNDDSGADTVLKSASDHYTREEMIFGVVRRLVDYEEDDSMRLGNLPITAYDEEIFTRAASYISESYFEQLMDSDISDARKKYLAKGHKEQKQPR